MIKIRRSILVLSATLVLVICVALTVRTGWNYTPSDRIQLWQAVGAWFFGIVGTLFIFLQNRIFSEQNRILEQQNETLENQRVLNRILIAREESEASKQETDDILSRIHHTVIHKPDDIDSALERLIAKGLSDREINARYYQLFHTPGSVFSWGPLKDSADRRRMKRAVEAAKLKKQTEPA